MKALVTLLTVVVLAVGASAAALDSKPAAPPAKPAPAAKPALPSSGQSVTGTVLETMDSGGYTYVKLKTGAGEVWAAVTQTRVQKGQVVTIATPMVMENFESKTLHRKFDRILFGTLAAAEAGNKKALPPGHPTPSAEAMRVRMAAEHSAAANPPASGEAIRVPRADGSSGRTIAELFSQRASLKDKEVAVRGKVVKFTPEVMGKNWLHLRDGSGSREKKNDDITVTTMGTVSVGDVILVRGVVKLDKDFGAGYTYSVILEDAKISK